MIATVNIIPTPESNPKRRRASSSASGSSSAISYDIPKTPVDAYNDLEGGRLGEDFTVLKMRQHTRDKTVSPAFDLSYFDRETEDGQGAVPPWLSDAMSTLGAQHPIRALVPASKPHAPLISEPGHSFAPPASLLRPLPQAGTTADDDPFAFRAPSRGRYDALDCAQADSGNYILNRHLEFDGSSQESLAMAEVSPQEIPSLLSHLSSSASPQTALFLGHVKSPIFTSSVEDARSTSRSPSPDITNALPSSGYGHHVPTSLAPFSTPGPFATNASRVPTFTSADASSSPPHASSSPPRASSALHPLSLSHVNSPSAFVASGATLPFSTPGPLAPSNPSIVSRSAFQFGPAVHRPIVFRQNTTDDDLDCPQETDSLLVASLHTPKPPFNLFNSRPISYTTPVPKRIYFDSPAEDPIGSDPLEPTEYELDLDYDRLDFRWERFDPAGIPGQDRASVSQQDVMVVLNDDDTSEDDEMDEAPTSQQLGSTRQRGDTLSSQRTIQSQVAPTIDNYPQTIAEHNAQGEALSKIDGENVVSAPPDSPPQGPSFAPAPGIYISPLRGDPPSESNQDNDKRNNFPDNNFSQVSVEVKDEVCISPLH